jgi:uncharacterized membrane protein
VTSSLQAGQLWFVLPHVGWFIIWIVMNAGVVPGILVFDPYPYQFLTFVVSLESIFLSLFILMSQNRANKQADSRLTSIFRSTFWRSRNPPKCCRCY